MTSKEALKLPPFIRSTVGFDKKSRTWWAKRYVLAVVTGNRSKTEALRKLNACHRDSFKVLTCVWCGCTDRRACAGGCSWVKFELGTNRGLCSACATVPR